MPWQPIATAPKDGNKILFYHGDGYVAEGAWTEAEEDGQQSMGHDAGWLSNTTFPSRTFGNPEYYSEAIDPPTHWMPLPEPPEETE